MSNQYEFHAAGLGIDESADRESFPWEHEEPPDVAAPFSVSAAEGTVWARLDETSGELERVGGPREAQFVFHVVKRRFSTDLALITRRHDVLVNGLPALKLTMLGLKDSVRLGPGRLFYITERVRPYVGQALEEHVGKKCPMCRMPITADTHVATCRCGAVYHHETAESHPELSDDDRLNCVSKVQVCLACGHALKLDEHLVWDPANV